MLSTAYGDANLSCMVCNQDYFGVLFEIRDLWGNAQLLESEVLAFCGSIHDR